MKNLMILSAVIVSLQACKKENKQSEQIVPVPFYFQLFSADGQTPIEFANSDLKIWYNTKNGGTSYIDNLKTIKMKAGDFKYGIMSQEMSFLSSFQKVTTFYVAQKNGRVDTIYLETKDLNINEPNVDRFPVVSVKFNGKPVKLDENYLPALWILKSANDERIF